MAFNSLAIYEESEFTLSDSFSTQLISLSKSYESNSYITWQPLKVSFCDLQRCEIFVFITEVDVEGLNYLTIFNFGFI
jgi:hypothetical protein